MISWLCAKREHLRDCQLTVRTKRPREILKHPATSVSELSRPISLQFGYLFGQNSEPLITRNGSMSPRKHGRLEERTTRRDLVSQISLLPPRRSMWLGGREMNAFETDGADEERSEPLVK